MIYVNNTIVTHTFRVYSIGDTLELLNSPLLGCFVTSDKKCLTVNVPVTGFIDSNVTIKFTGAILRCRQAGKYLLGSSTSRTSISASDVTDTAGSKLVANHISHVKLNLNFVPHNTVWKGSFGINNHPCEVDGSVFMSLE